MTSTPTETLQSLLPAQRTEADSLRPDVLALTGTVLAERGVAPAFVDAYGVTRTTPPATLSLLAQRFLGTEQPDAPMICTPGRYHPELHGRLLMEDGRVLHVTGTLPADLENSDPHGYHHLQLPDGTTRLVLAAPEHLPQPPRTWGWAVQLYAARTEESWGIGDFRDLARIARRAAADGAGAVLISPVHAMAPTLRQQNSPYSPTSRSWLNLQHVAPGDAPGAELVDLSDLAGAGRALNASRNIVRDEVWALKLEALRRIWAAVHTALPAESRSFRADGGRALELYSTYCAIATLHSTPNYREWPEELQHPDSPAVLHFASEHADEVAFWAWTQWVADLQFRNACKQGVDIVADLAVGFDGTGADAWTYQDLLASNFEVGCPPDLHNREGQRWGLPPFDPDALVRSELTPFRAMVAAGLRHAGALRIDHAMQLWRLYWVPANGAAADGAYVHYPVDALLAVLRIEAHRTGAWIVGEDMGTVADGVRETMNSIGMLGYRVSMRTNPAENPECSMGAVATHDQATVAGILTGSDALDMTTIGKAYDPEHFEHGQHTLATRSGVDLTQPIGPEEVGRAVLAQHRDLAASPSRIVVATLDDAAGVAERPNMPGTIDQWQNWRIALPVTLDELFDAPLTRTMVAELAANR